MPTTTAPITITTCLWQPRGNVQAFSRVYTPEWVDRLYRGFARNLTRPLHLVCFTDRAYEFGEPIEQVVDGVLGDNGYADCIRPFSLNVPMIFTGLDTVVTGNCDHLANYAMTADTMCLHRDPYNLSQAGNGVVLMPGGMRHVADDHRGENDMVWLRSFPHVFADDLFDGHIISYKARARKFGLGDARVVYFHGNPKPHEIDAEWVTENWR